MLTPLDIENREFKKTLVGYRREDVEDFLNLILKDYEKLYKENLAQRDKIELLTQAVNHFKSQEDIMKNSIVAAQKAADMLTHSSNESADVIVKEARFKAAEIVRDANSEISKLNDTYLHLRKEVESYKIRASAIIQAQLDVLQDIDTHDIGTKESLYFREDDDNVGNQEFQPDDQAAAN